MNMTYTVRLLAVFLLAALLLPITARASHVRAGEITTRRLPGTTLTYEITLTTYFDEQKGAIASSDANSATFCFGDGIFLDVPRRVNRRRVNVATSYNTYVTTYTFSGPGIYKISGQIINRNGDTKNLGGAGSDGFAFSVNTTIVVNAALGLNSTPVLLNPPLDSARVGQKFCHNPAAFDPDGDSLAYRLAIPETSIKDNPCRTYAVPAYTSVLNFSVSNEAGSGSATFTVNARTGDVCWDAPGQQGQYNIAFIIEEWRDGVLIGEVTRDMQIFVVDATNRRPLLNVPPDVCVQAGATLNQTVTATDPDNNRLTLTAFGGVFNKTADGIALSAPNLLVQPLAATFTTPAQPQPSQPQATGTFTWTTNCSHVREAPYEVIFRVIDSPGAGRTGLSSTASFNIKVIGAAPQGLTAKPAQTGTGRAIQLTWNPYACGTDSTRLIVYRREGCENDPIPPCTTGIPPGRGYVEIGRVRAGATSFLDTAGIRRGVAYNYRIVAAYPRPLNGFSVASAGACLTLALQAPILTQVTVDSTNSAKGVITVRWSRPIGLRPGDLGAPYQYRLLRSADAAGTSFTTVTSINTSLAPTAPDTLFTDRQLNTTANQYTYRIEFYYTDPATRQLTRFDVTDPATSVRLTVTGSQRQLQLSWQAQTPWTNDNQRHRIFRSSRGPNGPFNQIAEVAVTTAATYRYTDTGPDTYLADGNTSLTPAPDSSYCYRVQTVGRYEDARYNVGLIYNFSQITCASPVDTARPCPPNLSLDTLACSSLSPASGCGQAPASNNLRWTNPASTAGIAACDPNLTGYNVYYSRYPDEPTTTRLTSVAAPAMSFQHQNLTTVAGCYVVTAVNRRGVESLPGNRVCREVCPYFVLPNVFTPNGDGKNDVFRPMDCPRAVGKVEFTVYNRYGNKIFQTTDVDINWTGSTSAGQPVPSGVYYYEARVTFSTLQRVSPASTYKGWIQLMREGVSMR